MGHGGGHGAPTGQSAAPPAALEQIKEDVREVQRTLAKLFDSKDAAHLRPQSAGGQKAADMQELEARLGRFAHSREPGANAAARLGAAELLSSKLAELMRRLLTLSDRHVAPPAGRPPPAQHAGAVSAATRTVLAAAGRVKELHDLQESSARRLARRPRS